MRRPVVLSVALCAALLLPVAVHAAPAHVHVGATSASADEWPATRPGAVGRGWVEAFASGDSAMRAFYARELTAEALAKRGAGQRLEGYHGLRERFGSLAFASVVKSSPAELTVKLMDSDGKSHEFIFTVQDKTPFRLVSVSMKDMVSAHGGFGFHH